jgi:hypothetical protein
MPSNKKAKKQKPKRLAADRSSKATPVGMVGQGQVIGKQAPSSTIWQGNAAIKSIGQDAINACTVLGTDITNVSQLEIQLEAARSLRDADAVTCASKLDLFFTSVEDVATTPKDMQDLGITPLVGHTYALASPLSITAAVNTDTRVLTVTVKRAPGMQRTCIEISSDPTMATGVKVFPGDGVKQKMGPLTPGTYAIRACHVRAADRSTYTEIIPVTVK